MLEIKGKSTGFDTFITLISSEQLMPINKKSLFVFSFLLLSFWTTSVFATQNDSPIWKKKARVLVKRYVGENWAIKIFGEEKPAYELPAIPYVDEDAKSTEVYDKKYVEKVKIDNDQNLRLNIAFISELFEVIKERKGAGSEVGNWLNVMNQGGSREGVYRAMVLDQDYQGMENYDKLISNKGADFAITFSKRFAGMDINKETLQKINFYSVKRLVTEKALEIVDAYEDEEDLYKWYAILSLEFARDYQYAFSNQVRQNKEYEYHLNWANQAPRQHLKSEVIIKIHQIFNALQKVESN